MTKATYSAESIVWHKGLDGVRARPTMYIGGVGSAGVTHLAKEIIGNAIDEVSNGHGNTIYLTLLQDGTVIVKDNGRGVPVGPHPKHKNVDALTLIFSELHAGGKMNSKAYTTSIGVNGVGAAVVNALSSYTQVWTYHGGKKCHTQEFSKGKAKTPKPVVVKAPPKFLGIKDDGKGTTVAFRHDASIFDKGAKIDRKALIEWLSEMSWVVPAKIVVNIEGKGEVIVQRKGLAGRFEYECEKQKVEPLLDVKPFVVHTDNADIMIGWAATDESTIISSVSGVRTPQHGVHVNAFNKAMKAAFEELTKRGDSFTIDTLQAGMIAVVNVRLSEPKFTSQDKVKLESPEAGEYIAAAMNNGKTSFVAWVKNNRSKMRQLIDRANELAKLYSDVKADAKLAAAVKTESRGKEMLPAKLKASLTKNPDERELFIVEGESAGGTAVEARDPRFQEILCLKGKIPNVYKDPDKVSSNDSILDILKSIGFSTKDSRARRVGRVIVLTDPDADGSHIECLIHTLLLRYMPHLYTEKRVARSSAPLYFHRTDKNTVLGNDLADLKQKVGKAFDPNRVTRMKGWGEAPSDLLRSLAFDKANRHLTFITLADAKAKAEQVKRVVELMAEDVQARRELLNLD